MNNVTIKMDYEVRQRVDRALALLERLVRVAERVSGISKEAK